jgi:hypothetical protein
MKRKAAFLAAYRESGQVRYAAEAAGVCRELHSRWLKKDPAYAAEFERAKEDAADKLEKEAVRRASEGWLEPVYYKGKPVGAVRKFSDVLLIFTLKALRPEKYRERFEHTGANGGPVVVKVVYDELVKAETACA